MALHMILGAAGTGKSEYIFDSITKEADSRKDKRFFVIVPDQFTMQTQVDMVTKSGARNGIMNIDVLSFSRLAHRIYEETGTEGKLVLDDTGKSLILRKLAGEIKDDIPYIGANLKRDGFIGEVKSVISEFMQYGVGPQEIDELISISGGKGILATKLGDLKTIYTRFLEYIKDTYITTEESMDVLARELDKSELIKDSIVCLDGFTGFTPVQMKVLVKLMKLCENVYITLTLDRDDQNCKQEDLFWFTSKSYKTIIDAARENGVEVKPAILCKDNKRHEGKADLLQLERELFRYNTERYSPVEAQNISIYEAADIQDEVRKLAISIRKLVEEGAYYRDIAVVTGNMPDYENHIERVFAQFDIPSYIDKTHALVMNPFVEYSKSLLWMLLNDFDRESVIRFLRSGIGRFDTEDIDLFENFILMTGLRGYKRYSQEWVIKEGLRGTYASEEIMLRLNSLREQIVAAVSSFAENGIGRRTVTSAKKYVETLYKCFVESDMYSQLDEYSKMFEAKKDYTREREYAQIYRLTMQLLEQIHGLLGEEELSLEEFARIMEAGFDEITVGTIPQSVDRVIVGDIERSRLKPVKYLFFVGANDTAIPKKGSSGSIISDLEREKLSEQGLDSISLAPTPRERMYIQRFYLYNNLVKPSDKLFISYSLMSGEGKSIRPAYIIPMIKKLFIWKDSEDEAKGLAEIYNYAELKEYVCDLLRRYGEVSLDADEMGDLMQAISLMISSGSESSKDLLEMMINNSFFKYTNQKLDAKIAGIMYGETLLASISKMEKYAECAYSYFLNYGLSLKERQNYDIDNREMGTIFHGVLEQYGQELKQRELNWFDVDEDTSARIIDEQLEKYINENGSVLNDSKAGEYIKRRMSKVMHKAVSMLSFHLKAGSFSIDSLEMSFKSFSALDEINIAFDKQEKMQIEGRIDRIDTLKKDDKVYVKVIDYKTGDKDFSLLNFYYGLDLQLVVYMSEGLKHVKRGNRDKDVIPAAILYYHVADDRVNVENEGNPDKINKLIIEDLRTKGLVNDDLGIISALDGSIEGKSMVIPVSLKNDGSISKSGSRVMSQDNLRLLSDFADYKLRNIGNEIIKGNISKNPYVDGDREACTYCSFKDVCGFEEKLDGYEKLKLIKEDNETLLNKMKQEMEEE